MSFLQALRRARELKLCNFSWELPETGGSSRLAVTPKPQVRFRALLALALAFCCLKQKSSTRKPPKDGAQGVGSQPLPGCRIAWAKQLQSGA